MKKLKSIEAKIDYEELPHWVIAALVVAMLVVLPVGLATA